MKTTTHTQSSKAATTLILGGNGKTGRRVVQRLNALGHSVRIGSRAGTPSFDWHKPATWEPVLEGIREMYIAYHPDLAVPGASEHIRELVALAKKKDLRKIVLLSGRGEEEAQLCERIALNSGIPTTVVRCSWFNQNFTESFLRDMVVDGTIALPVNQVREPFVDADDIADVVVASLTEDHHAGKIYELTGPELLSFTEVAREISTQTGRTVEFVEISLQDFVRGLEEAKLPTEMVSLIRYLFSQIMDGRNEKLTDGVQQALGRDPRTFRDFVIASHQSQLWNA